MIDAERKKQAQQNLAQYLQDGLIKKGKNETAKAMYLKNAETSLHLAEDCIRSSLKPYLWTVVISYYSMFYIANAVLLDLGYKTSHKIVHKVTNEALIRRSYRILWAGDGQEVKIPVRNDRIHPRAKSPNVAKTRKTVYV